MGLITWIKENFTKFPNGCKTGNESKWMLKDNCPCCIANPIAYLSNAKYHSKYPPKNKLSFGRISIYLCDFHLNKLMKIDQIEEKIFDIQDQLMRTSDCDLKTMLRCKMHGLEESLEILKSN